MVRRAARVDENQSEIVASFRAMGCSVADTSAVGDGFPDLVVGKFGITVLVEVKNPRKIPSKRRLTPDQKDFHDEWNGSITIVETLDDVIDLVSRMRRSAEALNALNVRGLGLRHA